MSGGHFNYQQYTIRDMIDELKIIVSNDTGDMWDNINDKESMRDIIEITIAKGMVFETLINRIDYLMSGDDGEESFYDRLSFDLGELGEYDASS